MEMAMVWDSIHIHPQQPNQNSPISIHVHNSLCNNYHVHNVRHMSCLCSLHDTLDMSNNTINQTHLHISWIFFCHAFFQNISAHGEWFNTKLLSGHTPFESFSSMTSKFASIVNTHVSSGNHRLQAKLRGKSPFSFLVLAAHGFSSISFFSLFNALHFYEHEGD